MVMLLRNYSETRCEMIETTERAHCHGRNAMHPQYKREKEKDPEIESQGLPPAVACRVPAMHFGVK